MPREKKSTTPHPPEPQVIPLAEERLTVGKKVTEGSGVRVHKRVTEETLPIDVPLLEEALEVERVRVDREVERPEPIREEGDVLVIPLHEEVTVVQKKLLVREELRVVRRREERSEHLEERLRSEVADISRLPPKKNP